MSSTYQPTFASTPSGALIPSEQLHVLARQTFGAHPFERPLSRELLESLLPEYLAMSQAFPYLQAASQKENIFEVITNNSDVPAELELTSVVGNFLSWDETGGHDVVLRYGKEGLPRILETDRRFHANLLRKDASRILGRPVHPHYGPTTRPYLHALYQGLSSLDPVRRCAHMIAFELHASTMIESLWTSLATATGLAHEELLYFAAHVGGSDPAEKYHEEMTDRLIGRIVPVSKQNRFLGEFLSAYRLSFEWCQTLVQLPLVRAIDPTPAAEVWHEGACHCRGVRFQVRALTTLSAVRCNCSICSMTGFLHLIVPADHLRILNGEDLITTYQFNSRTARHSFCRVCGVKAFYRRRSNPDSYSVNVRCLSRSRVESLEISNFQGQHWEEAIADPPEHPDATSERFV